MNVIRQLIGAFSLVLVGIAFVLGDLWGRIRVDTISPRHAERREQAVRSYVQGMRRVTLWIVTRVGRARLEVGPRIPCQGGVLIVMNHQSLLDIPVAASMMEVGYPRFVTHYRYASGIPLVSHMIRMMGSISVHPGKMGKTEFERLAEAARASEYPIVLFPEGHRTKDGEIRPWKRGALDAFLSAGAWSVHVIVLDGLWQAARLPDFVRTLTRVRCRVESAGVFEYDGRNHASHDEFVARIHRAMCDKLSEMRRETREPENNPRPTQSAHTR